MPPPAPELADIFRQYGPAYRQAHALPLHQHRLMQAIETCRTPALGEVVEWCDHCQYTHTRYRSCRNRHCPKCQGAAREKWLEQRRAELLPTAYFHVVFTLPGPHRLHRLLQPGSMEKPRLGSLRQAPFGGPQQVLEYLGRYTHRVAISNRRLLQLQEGQVSFQWKDYRDANRSKVMTVSAEEFIGRFLQHALPP